MAEPILDVVVDAIGERTARGVAAAISRLVTTGALPPGTRLPTVRELARRLGISPTTVSEAWQSLAQVGAIAARGRLGTFVLDATRPPAPKRYRRLTAAGDVGHHNHFALDLSTGTPDPDLLPDLGPVLARVARHGLTTSYLDDPVLPSLDTTLRARWPFEPEAITVVDGAMDAIDRICTQRVRLGDRVLVENPCFAPLADLLEQLGAEPIGLPLDDQGIVPEALRDALRYDPVALFLQPRAQNPSGVSMAPMRARKLATLLRGTSVLVIEDDHSGDIATSEAVSIGTHLPERTAHILSFSKSHGPDLRLAAVGGAGRVINELVARRMLGPGWSSRLLQAVLVELLHDPATVDTVERARAVYAERRKRLVAALETRGVATTGTDGINLWVEVADEQAALVTLAARGIGVAPGSPFVVDDLGADHVRITVSRVPDDPDELADLIATAALRPTSWGRRQ